MPHIHRKMMCCARKVGSAVINSRRTHAGFLRQSLGCGWMRMDADCGGEAVMCSFAVRFFLGGQHWTRITLACLDFLQLVVLKLGAACESQPEESHDLVCKACCTSCFTIVEFSHVDSRPFPISCVLMRPHPHPVFRMPRQAHTSRRPRPHVSRL